MSDTGTFAELSARFSEARMSYYLDGASGDGELAVQLYDWNLRLGGAFFEDIAVVEVLVRNAFDQALKEQYESGDTPWWDVISGLRADQINLLESATQTAISETGDDPPFRDSIVARLSLGFWSGLLDPRFNYLWPTLKPVFGHSGLKAHQDNVEGYLQDLRDLRNAIAHHDPIIDWPFERCIKGMDNLTGPISPEVLKWMRSRSRVKAVLAEDPRR